MVVKKRELERRKEMMSQLRNWIKNQPLEKVDLISNLYSYLLTLI